MFCFGSLQSTFFELCWCKSPKCNQEIDRIWKDSMCFCLRCRLRELIFVSNGCTSGRWTEKFICHRDISVCYQVASCGVCCWVLARRKCWRVPLKFQIWISRTWGQIWKFLFVFVIIRRGRISSWLHFLQVFLVFEVGRSVFEFSQGGRNRAGRKNS